MKKYLFAALTLFLASCVYNSDTSFIDAHKEAEKTISSNRHYEEVYQILAKQYRSCGRRSFNFDEVLVESKLDQATHTGTITQSIKAPLLSPNYAMVIKIQPASIGSQILIYQRDNMFNEDNVELITKWLNGREEC